VDPAALLDHLAARGGVVALIPNTAAGTSPPASNPAVPKKWHTVREVADMLGYGLSKTKMLIAMGEIRSLKDGRNRRILPEWVDEYVARRAAEAIQGRSA
jgi:excisionase family DNA binding protein